MYTTAIYLKTIQHLLLSCLLFVLLSCSDTPKQYNLTSDSTVFKDIYNVPFPSTQASNEQGGLLAQEREELSEEEKDRKTRANSLVPIDYKTGSAGNISIKTTYEETLDILNLSQISNNLYIYREGLLIIWREKAPRTPYIIALGSTYQGTLDLGPWVSEKSKRYVKVGQSFTDYFDLKVEDIREDKKAQQFIVSLYKHFENTEENCLEEKKCFLSVTPNGTYISFRFPKMVLLFGKNERRVLIQLNLINSDDSGCFARPFDLLDMQFFCEKSDTDFYPTVGLGTPYGQAIQIAGINSELPISHSNQLLIQSTKSTTLGWEREEIEKDPKSVPEDSPLSYLGMYQNYTLPFLLDQSLIKITLINSNQVFIRLDPLNNNWTIEDIEKKLENIESEENSFYLSSSIPQIRGKHILQKNLIKSLLDFLEVNYSLKENYSTPPLNQSSGLKIYKRVYGEYTDKQARESNGRLIIDFPDSKKSLALNIIIDGASGDLDLDIGLITNDFFQYVIDNQRPIIADQFITKLAGFTLGDKIYLRNKNIGARTAIVTYPTSNQKLLTALTNYGDDGEAPVIYQNGKDSDPHFQQSKYISTQGVLLYINPSFQVKEIAGNSFDEYEINGIATDGRYFFETISNVCSLESFEFKMGMYDRFFTQSLIEKISSARTREDFTSCPYISPQDSLFYGLKRDYYFPTHRLYLGFVDRELFQIGIYKKPSENLSLTGVAQ